MKIILMFLISSFTTLTMANITPARVLSITTDNALPTATYKLTVEIPCWATRAGVIKEHQGDFSDTLILGVILNIPAVDVFYACEALPTEDVVEFKVSKDHPIENLIILGRMDGVEVVVEEPEVDANKEIYEALEVEEVISIPEVTTMQYDVTIFTKSVGGLTCTKTKKIPKPHNTHGKASTTYECNLDESYKANQIYRAINVIADTDHRRDGYLDTKIAGNLVCALEVIEEGTSGSSNYATFSCELKN